MCVRALYFRCCVCVYHMCADTHRLQKRMLSALELPHVCPGNRTPVLWKTAFWTAEPLSSLSLNVCLFMCMCLHMYLFRGLKPTRAVIFLLPVWITGRGPTEPSRPGGFLDELHIWGSQIAHYDVGGSGHVSWDTNRTLLPPSFQKKNFCQETAFRLASTVTWDNSLNKFLFYIYTSCWFCFSGKHD